MEPLKSVTWSWNYGKVISELTYRSGNTEVRVNKKPPPTKASHDITHFICGFHEDMEWDYESIPNHYAEYNAVYLEHLLHYFCFYRNKRFDAPVNVVSKNIFDYMKWFSREHYYIHKNHPKKQDYLENQSEFLSKLNVSLVQNHFKSYYDVWINEQMMGSDNFNISIEMNDTVDFQFKPLYNYLKEMKTSLQSLAS